MKFFNYYIYYKVIILYNSYYTLLFFYKNHAYNLLYILYKWLIFNSYHIFIGQKINKYL